MIVRFSFSVLAALRAASASNPLRPTIWLMDLAKTGKREKGLWVEAQILASFFTPNDRVYFHTKSERGWGIEGWSRVRSGRDAHKGWKMRWWT
ncbi:hypothetical protein BGZ63DRAFT_106993 [Mariannaea sp. PMI_226]|nr:hypothetical protein BGZ63DRAFT_106993 [Mariannaea sp. PMI_226]